MTRIDNWITTKKFDPHIPPDYQIVCLQGYVSGHTRFTDKTFITTSPIVDIKKREILTQSGTIYKLGRIDRRFRYWLRKNRPNWNWRNPITIKKGKSE
jgi:hypothetical protein